MSLTIELIYVTESKQQQKFLNRSHFGRKFRKYETESQIFN